MGSVLSVVCRSNQKLFVFSSPLLHGPAVAEFRAAYTAGNGENSDLQADVDRFGILDFEVRFHEKCEDSKSEDRVKFYSEMFGSANPLVGYNGASVSKAAPKAAPKSKKKPKKKSSVGPKAVLRVESGLVTGEFPSMAAAARKAKVTSAALREAIDTGGLLKGAVWKLADGEGN